MYQVRLPSVAHQKSCGPLTPLYRYSLQNRSPDHVFHFNLHHLSFVRPSVPVGSPGNPLKPIVSQWYLFAIYTAPNETIQVAIYRHFLHHLPRKLRYIRFIPNPSNSRSLSSSSVGSISVSVKASQNALCSVFSSFPSNQDCKWGGASIILPWVSVICGGFPLSSYPPEPRKTHVRFNRRRRIDLHNG